ncbi:MAG: GNAT family N-acetyltransferase [Gaiellaceae bacterium]
MAAQVIIPDAVRQLAEHPMRELPIPPTGYEKVEIDGAIVVMTPFPLAQCVEPLDVDAAGIPRAVEAARAVARARGKSILAWWITPEYAHLAPALEERGLVNEDTPGFEAIENAMALVTAPDDASLEAVEVKAVSSFEEFAGGARVSMDSFDVTPAMRAEIEAGLPERYEESVDPANPGRGFVALVDGHIVGSATAVLAAAGVNLFGGAVLSHARGRGVYRALVVARWRLAEERGTPALTIQAGRMSKPIAERLGFVQVSAVRLYVDTFQ